MTKSFPWSEGGNINVFKRSLRQIGSFRVRPEGTDDSELYSDAPFTALNSIVVVILVQGICSSLVRSKGLGVEFNKEVYEYLHVCKPPIWLFGSPRRPPNWW